MTDNCLFCGISSGVIPSDKVFEDDLCFAFNDIAPQAPIHVLIVPKKHVDSLDKLNGFAPEILGHLMLKTSQIAKDLGVGEEGYRVVINTNGNGGQTVYHLHLHLLAGRSFIFPPG